MQKFTLFLLFTLACNGLFAQLSGKLTDTEGGPLPFASIYIKGSTNGTTSNINGEYSLSLSSGSYDVIFQYIGYESKTIRVNMTPIAARIANIVKRVTWKKGAFYQKITKKFCPYRSLAPFSFTDHFSWLQHNASFEQTF